MTVSIPHDPEKGLHELVWVADKVFVFGCYMCWVDYLSGALLCDVFAAGEPELRFLRLPGVEISGECRDFNGPEQIVAAYRTVDVGKGVVKFVDVTVTTWTLRMPELVWEKDGAMRVDELWSSCHEFRQSLVPRWPPERPVVSKQDPDAVHFILKECGLRNKSWMITLDTREMAMRSYMRYTEPGKEALLMWCDPEDEEWDNNDDDDDDDGGDGDGGVATIFSGSLLICPEFCTT